MTTNDPNPNLPQAVTRRIAKARPGTVRLWTIQPLPVWEKLRQQGTLWVDSTDEEFSQVLQEYDWMCQQMRRRLPEYEGHYPWWAYDYKLDLRSFRHQVYGDRQVLLELAVPSERLLFSAYGAWHYILNRFYPPHAVDEAGYEREQDAWDAELESQVVV